MCEPTSRTLTHIVCLQLLLDPGAATAHRSTRKPQPQGRRQFARHSAVVLGARAPVRVRPCPSQRPAPAPPCSSPLAQSRRQPCARAPPSTAARRQTPAAIILAVAAPCPSQSQAPSAVPLQLEAPSVRGPSVHHPRSADADLWSPLPRTARIMDPKEKPDATSSLPTPRLDCIKCFDMLWFCYSPFHQMQNYYRYGEFDTCFGKWGDLMDCLVLKTKRKAEVEEILIAREKAKPHIWTYRTVDEASENWWRMYKHAVIMSPQSGSAQLPPKSDES